MKKYLIFTLLTFYLLSSTELRQLSKLPFLFEHYVEHVSKEKGLSFSAFLELHYSTHVNYDNDYDKDMKLPFKTHDGCLCNNTTAFLPDYFAPLHFKPVYTGLSGFKKYQDAFVGSSYLSNIWQPPKTA